MMPSLTHLAAAMDRANIARTLLPVHHHTLLSSFRQ